MRPNSLIAWGIAGAWLVPTALLAGNAAVPDFRPLTLEARRAIDARALQLSDEAPDDPRGRAVGAVSGFVIGQTPLSNAEERARAESAHRAIVSQARIVETPEAARRVLERLVAELPPRMRPEGWRFTLTVIDAPQADAFTVGGGFLYVTRPYLDAALADPAASTGRLAFLIGSQLGHNGLGHTRRAYQMIALQEILERRPETGVEPGDVRRAVGAVVRFVGDRLSFLYSRSQVYEADLFALHLCRNAKIDLEDSLDILRGWGSVPVEADETAAAGATGEREPGAASPLVRLRALRQEIDGTVSSESAGLFEYDHLTHQCAFCKDRPLKKGERAIVFIHGLGSDLAHFRAMIAELAEDERLKGIRLLGFQYPNDASLWRMGRFLKREMARYCETPATVDFVCHSAGGLVFRDYAEREGGAFRRAVFLGTPHAGSDLAKLRPLLETRRAARVVQLGYPEALESAITDGRGQIGIDLQPDSLFLRYLNGAERDAGRYLVVRGRAIDTTKSALVELGLSAARAGLMQALRRGTGESRVQQLGHNAAENLRIPAEVARGDLAVTLDSATLKGASAVETFDLNHMELTDDPEVIDVVRTFLLK